jgi:hypothetical protein
MKTAYPVDILHLKGHPPYFGTPSIIIYDNKINLGTEKIGSQLYVVPVL